MRPDVPRTPFSTGLSSSAKAMEGRVRNILQGEHKRPPLLLMLMVAFLAAISGTLVHCFATPSETWNLSAPSLEENPVMMLNDESLDEVAVEGISIIEGNRFQDLPADKQAAYQKTRTIPGQGDMFYDVDVYEGAGMNLYVINAPEASEDGNLCGIRVTQPGIATARGLQVGDSEERARMLYGTTEERVLYQVYRLSMDIQGGEVTSYTLGGRFWGPRVGV